MPTTRVPAYRCSTEWSGWLDDAHPTVEDGEIRRTVCFSDRATGCKKLRDIFVKNCGSYFIYKLQQTRYEANIPRVVRGFINRTVGTCV